MSKLEFILSDKKYKIATKPDLVDIGRSLYGVRVVTSNSVPEGSALMTNGDQLVWVAGDMSNFREMVERAHNNPDFSIIVPENFTWGALNEGGGRV
jgi:hypothetical protein